jgi:2'-5' RNA ligase
LRFIGDIDHAMARDVFALMAETRLRAPFAITFDRLEHFGGDRPRAVFAHIIPSPELLDLQAEQERKLRRLGLPAETRKFTPHVTLARLRDASPLDVADYFATRGVFNRQTFMAERFVVFSSRNSVGGGPYVVEAAYPLR